MTKRILVAALIALTVPTAAQAHTAIIEPEGSHFPYQQWVDEAKVPTPDATITVVEGPCPGLEDPALGCTPASAPTIYSNIALIREFGFWAREVFFHEMGHRFADEVLEPWSLASFRRIRHSQRPWQDSEAPEGYGLEEVFANAYAGCAIATKAIFANSEVTYSPPICRLIRLAYKASRQA